MEIAHQNVNLWHGRAPSRCVWHAVLSADMPTTWHPVLPPPSLPFGMPPPARAEMWLDSESHRSDVTFQKAGGLGKPSFSIICHGIILWIIWGDHGYSSPNTTVSANAFAIRSVSSQGKNMILLIQRKNEDADLSQIAEFFKLTNSWTDNKKYK